MRHELVSDEMWAAVEPLLPEEPPKPKGGRPRVPDRDALRGIVFVLRSGLPWEMLPREVFGCSGMTCWRRLRDWQQAGVWDRLHRTLLERLHRSGELDWGRTALDSQSTAAKKGGAATGPNPTDRGKPGTKRHTVTDARGTPLGLTLTGANRHDSMALAAALDAVPGVRSGGPGRPRMRPDKLHADKAYDSRRCRRECRARGITPRIARKRIDRSDRLGRHRWVVERTFAWMDQFRRLVTRYERRADIHAALTKLAACMICLNQISRFC
ncbi:IS5 family transposase [Jannaschia formosa]|uniref:IS5 family transposase n=1 Tax=Jannaschia formosa TaxID=2259592 RepID=UPI000E1B7D89|nr:IS5 family transposase [Jannaschia formosa]TFL16195.1 IS5 family transposase [Jannaschia formosa]